MKRVVRGRSVEGVSACKGEPVREVDDVFEGLLGVQELPLLGSSVFLRNREVLRKYLLNKQKRTLTGNGSESP